MSAVRQSARERAYHPSAYEFIFEGLRHAQQSLGRDRYNTDTGHVSGPELLFGVRDLAQEKFGLMARCVLGAWGVNSTADIGKMVFELIEDEEMRASPDDNLQAFVDIYDFEQTFDRDYVIKT